MSTTYVTMTADEFRAAIKLLGFTKQEAAAEWLGYNRSTVRRWLSPNDPQEIPVAVAKLLRLMVSTQTMPDAVDQIGPMQTLDLNHSGS